MATAVARVSIDATGAKQGASEYRQELQRLKDATKDLDAALKAGKVSKSEYREEMKRLRAATKETEQGFKHTVREAKTLSEQYKRLAGDLNPAIRAQESYVKAQRTLAAALRSGIIGQQTYNRQLELATARYRTASRGASQFATSFTEIRAGLGVIAGALAALGITRVFRSAFNAAQELGSEIGQTGSRFQQLRVQLETATGSLSAASAAMEQIKDFATATPFEVENLTQAYIRLVNFGIDPTERTLTALGNIAAAYGKDITDFTEAVTAATTGETERLKQFAVAAKTQGDKITFTFRGMSETVGRNASEISNYFVRLGETEFAGGMERQAATVEGAWSNVEDAASSLYDTIAQRSGLLEIQEQLFRTLAEAIGANEDQIGDLSESLTGTLLPVVEQVGILVAKTLDLFDLLGIKLEHVGAVIKAVGGALPVLGPLLRDLDTARMVLAGQAGVDTGGENEAAFRKWIDNLERRIERTKHYTSTLGDLYRAVDELTDAQEELNEALRSGDEARVQAAMAGLTAAQSRYNEVLRRSTQGKKEDTDATDQLTAAQVKLLDSLRNNAVGEAHLAKASEEALRVYRATIEEYGTGEAARSLALRRSDEALQKAKESLEIWNALHKEGVTANAELRAAIIANLSAMQLSERLRNNNAQLLRNEQTLAENAAEAYDDFTDSFEEATAARERLQQAFRTGSEQSLRESAAILAVYAAMPRSQKELEDALFAANLKLEVQRRILAETAKGSGLAAEEIERLTTQELSMARAAEMAAENWEKLTVDLEAIWTEFAEGTQDALVDFLAEGMGSIVDLFADGTFDIEALFDDLWRSVVDAAIQAAAEAAAAWIAAQAASGWATGGTGTGGGTNWASMLGGWGAKMFGGGGGQPSGWDFGPGNVGDTGGGGGGASSVIAWAAVAAIIGAIGYSQGWWGTKGSEARAGATFGGEDLDTIDTWANKSKNLKPVMEKVRAAIEDIRSFVEGVGLEIERFGEVTLQKVRQTYSAQARSATGEILAGVSLAGKSAEEISDALAALAIRTADFGPSVSAFLAAVIHNSDSITTAQLEAEIEMARMIESLGRTDFELRMESIGGRFDAMFEFVARQLADDLEQASAGFGRIVLGEAEEWRAAWRELTGVQLTPEEQLEIMRSNARVFEAEKALRLAELRARIEFLEAEKRLAELRARIGLEDLRAQVRIESGRHHAELAAARGRYKFALATVEVYQFEESVARAHMETMGVIVAAGASILDAEIAALNELIAALEAIPTIDIEGLRLSGGGGGRRREDQRQLADLLDEFDLSQLGEVEQAIIRLNQQWDEAAELAHGNAELLERVAEARKRGIAALEESLREDVFERLAAFEPLSDVERQLLDITRERTEIEERLRELYQAGIVTAEELADAQARLTAAEAQRREEIERGILSEANNLLVDLLEAAGRTEEAAELRWRLEMEAYRLRLLTLEAEYALLNRLEARVYDESGNLIASNSPDFARMWELFSEVLGLGPPAAGAGGGPTTGGPTTGGTSEADRERERAQEILQGFLDLELNPFERDLRDLNETFAELRSILGDSAEVAHAYELALADLQERYTAGLREFLAELRDPTLNPAETVETLQQRFLELAATGDLSQSQELAQLGAQLRAAYLSAYGSAGGGFGELLDLIESTIEMFLGGGGIPAALNLPALGAGGGPLGIVPQTGGGPATYIAASVAAPGVETRLDRILAAVERGSQQQHRDFAAGREEQRQGTQRVAASLRDNRKVRLGAAA